MAAGTVLSAELLAIAGIPSTSDLYGMLLGITAAQARSQLETILQLVPVAVAIQRRGVFDYSVDGQSAKIDFAQVEKALAMVRRLASNGGGPVPLRVVVR